MAVDTAPAAVPGPDEQPAGQQAPAPGGFVASLLTPVEPARPLTAMTTAPAGPQPAAGVPAGISSAAFHEDQNNPEGNSENSKKSAAGNSSSGREASVIRAWLLAGAERWRKGAGANIKRLEVKKAQAAADAAAARSQPKVPAPRQAPAGSASSGGGAGKGPAKSPARGQGSSGGPRNTSPSSPKTPRGPAAPSPAPKQPKTPSTPSTPTKTPTTAPTKPTTAPKPPKPNTPTSHTNPAPSPKAPAPSKDSRSSKGAGSDRSDRKSHKTAPAPTPGGGSGPRPSSTPTTKAAHGPNGLKGPKNTASATPKNNTPESGADKTKTTGRTTTPQPGSKTGTPQTPDKGLGKTLAPKTTTPGKPDTDQAKPQTGKDQAPKKTTASGTAAAQAATTDRAMFTRNARHTGYRDGYRAGRVAAQARAYRHGVHDGWTSVMTAADDEKTLLDHARAQRQEERKDNPVPTQTTPAPVPPKPTHAPAVPLTVTGINATTVYLGDGAARTTMSRGEIRSLKTFERRLEAQRTEVQLVAEETKGLAWHADQQAAKAIQLLEQAKAVKGGEKLLQRLSRLQDDAKAQVALAQDLHKQAVRGADATGAVLANTQTRYGPIYKAVVDSDETAPAELRFYKG